MATYISGAKAYGSPSCFKPGGLDPLAQSFFVDTPLVLTKVDLFFYSKDNNIPVKLQIRKMVNGFPGSTIIPLSETVVYPGSISISDDGSTATSVSFTEPIYLDIGEYALVLLTDSLNYRVWISEIGQEDLVTDSVISEQPYIGVLFKSQNASTWSPNQYQDLKFTLYRASFDTSVTGTLELTVPDTELTKKKLEIDPLEVSPNSNIMRVYHENHGQNAGSYVRLTGFVATNSFGYLANSNFYGITIDKLENVPFEISNTTINSYTISLPSEVNGNVTSIIRTGGYYISATQDFKYDTYYPGVSVLRPPGTSVVHKVKSADAETYAMDTSFTTISVEDTDFSASKILASNTSKQKTTSNTDTFYHQIEFSTTSNFLSPMIDTKLMLGSFARNVINNPTYDTENKSGGANDVVTIASASNIKVTQISGRQGLITLTNASDKTNAAAIIKGTYLNITANNGVNNGQYRVLNVTDSGANISIFNVSTTNVSTNSTATYTITNGRNFIAEEAAYDGSVASKYITREVSLVNPCTAFKFYLDVAKPTDANVNFYYKVSNVGDTVDLKDKEYTKVEGVTIIDSLDGTFNEVEKIVENLPQFDAIIFKIVFLGDDSSQVPKCKNLRIIAFA
jgi:hypothetical protein